MANNMHIVNGDSTREILEQSGLEGTIVVWREMLCDGPVSEPIFSDEFWQARYQFFEDELEVPRLEYYDKTIKELLKAEFLDDVGEVVLWFEYDLFCQVNLMALCSFLLEHFRKDVVYSMVCVGREEGREGWQTLADFTPEEFPALYEKRINMSRASFEYAHDAWKAFASNNKEVLQNFNFRKNKRFKYFDVAMKQQEVRFPDAKGLNQIDYKILQVIQEGGHDVNEVLKLMLIWQRYETVYGFGDLQYALRLKHLEDYFESREGILQLNEKGLNLLN